MSPVTVSRQRCWAADASAVACRQLAAWTQSNRPATIAIWSRCPTGSRQRQKECHPFGVEDSWARDALSRRGECATESAIFRFWRCAWVPRLSKLEGIRELGALRERVSVG